MTRFSLNRVALLAGMWLLPFLVSYGSQDVGDSGARRSAGEIPIVCANSVFSSETLRPEIVLPVLRAFEAKSLGGARGSATHPKVSDLRYVTLLSFEAAAQSPGDSVVISWETAAEVSNIGFNLYRFDPEVDPSGTPGMKLNQTLILATGSPSSGATYEWTDHLVLQLGETRYYFLEDIDLVGGSTLNGPAVATFVTVPAIERWVIR